MLIKPDAYVHSGKIIDHLYKSGFMIAQMKMGRFTPATTARFLQQNNCQSAEASEHMMSDVSIGIEVVAEDACNKLQACAEQIKKQFG